MSQKFLDLAGLTAYDAKIKGWVKSGTVDITNDEINALFAPQIEFVDLGLSVKWATSLLGATNGDTAETWYGNYYAWGETEPKDDYSWSTYKFGASSPFSKYDSDDKTVLESVDDVATVTNSAWRMPTEAECQELMTLPNQWVTDYNGISGLNGRVFTSTNGNTLFIPAAGFRDGSDIHNVGSDCCWWSSNLTLGDHQNAYSLNFNSDNIYMYSDNRYDGCSVCPVC